MAQRNYSKESLICLNQDKMSQDKLCDLIWRETQGLSLSETVTKAALTGMLIGAAKLLDVSSTVKDRLSQHQT